MDETLCVAVTGGNGYIGFALVRELLEAGHIVQVTVRDAFDERRTGALYSLPHADRLRLFSASLLTPTAVNDFATAFAGASVVFHSAAPVALASDDGQSSIVDPIVKGTEAVLEAVARVASVKQLVYTSSVAACLNVNDVNNEGRVFTEHDWNMTSLAATDPYRFAKRRAEQLVWAWGKAHPQVAITSILPFLVVGDVWTAAAPGVTLNMSLDVVYRLLTGRVTHHPGHAYGISDVADVVRAHVRAAANPAALNKRYLCVGATLPYSDLCDQLRAAAPDCAARVPVSRNPESPLCNFGIACDLIERDLGLRFTPLADTLRTTVRGLRENGWLEQGQ